MAHPDHILFLVSRLQERAYRFIARELQKRGINGIEPSHGAILRQLSTYGPLSMSRLAELIDRTKPTVTVLVRKLVKHGYVERMEDPTDSRVTLVRLTDKAKALADDFQDVSRLMRERIYKGFSKKDRQSLVDQLERAIRNFRKT
jgi:DNA-binding MarR family transcriptional regulator